MGESPYTDFSENENRRHKQEDEVNDKLVIREGCYHILVKPYIHIKEIDTLIARLIELKNEIQKEE
jgi:hypothetical protein